MKSVSIVLNINNITLIHNCPIDTYWIPLKTYKIKGFTKDITPL